MFFLYVRDWSRVTPLTKVNRVVFVRKMSTVHKYIKMSMCRPIPV